MKTLRIEPGDKHHASFAEAIDEGESPDFPRHFEECNHRRYYSPKARLQQVWKEIVKISNRFDDWCDQSFLHMAIVVSWGGLGVYAAFGLCFKFFG